MTVDIEVCIDNLESLHLAIEGGATRIELCSSLALGGLTPSVGFMRYAAMHSCVPVHAMIRPRQGDFLYQEAELHLMEEDIRAAASAGVQGVVFGILNADGTLNIDANQRLIALAQSLQLSVTFHRAIDQCCDPFAALDWLIEQGCQLVLTSGLASSAPEGQSMLAKMVQHVKGQITIMAGAGVNASNVQQLVSMTGVNAIHLSGKGQRDSQMCYVHAQSKMGTPELDDFIVPVTNPQAIANTIMALNK